VVITHHSSLLWPVLLLRTYVLCVCLTVCAGFNHRLRLRILRILKFRKIRDFFTNFILKPVNFKIHKIQIITLIVAKFQQTLRPKGT